MYICHLKNAELETKHHKYKGRVEFRGDIAKIDSGSYAALTEQRSSASQMTAAKVMDFMSRLPGCAGQAADAVSAYTQVKMEDALYYSKFQFRNVQTLGFVYHDTNGLNHWSSMEDPVVLLERNLHGHLLAGLLWERQFRENPIEVRLGEGFQLTMLIRTPAKRVILICVCGWQKIGWKETKSWSDVETTEQRSWFGRTNNFPGSCILGMHSKTMWNKQR